MKQSALVLMRLPHVAIMRWLAALLAAVALARFGIWLERNAAVNAHVPSFFAEDVSMLSRVHLLATTSSKPLTSIQSACRHAIVPLNPSCPRHLVARFLDSAGFGHQFSELVFGMYAAQYLGLTFTYNAISTSGDHDDDYTGLVETLGLERFFVEGLGLARGDDLRQLRRENASLFGQWIEAANTDKRAFSLACNNSVLAIDGWWHCHGVADRNCFWAAEHEFLFQRYSECFRSGVYAYGTVFKRCVLLSNGEVTLPHDTLVVVWHLRFGDVSPRKADDAAFFRNVVHALMEVLPRGVINLVRIVLVGGGGRGNQGVPIEYVQTLRGVVAESNVSRHTKRVSVRVERFNTSSFHEEFLAMMQADILIGSGSSVPQVAALLSGRPLFFNHVPKHGYGYGQEAMVDSVDMDGQGRVLDSLRRVRLAMLDKMVEGGLCRRPRMDF
jgi:hypothetical protein